jgi:hypothetical protein
MLRHRIQWLKWHAEQEQAYVSPALAKHRDDQLRQWQQELEAINPDSP